MAIILAELQRLARDGLRPAELARVKNQLKGNLLLGLETSDSRMSRIAKNEIYFRRDIPLAEIAARIDATTNDEIVALADRLVRPDGMAVTLLGDLGGRRSTSRSSPPEAAWRWRRAGRDRASSGCAPARRSAAAARVSDRRRRRHGPAAPTSTSPLTLAPGERALVPTGLAVEIPPGFEAQVRPRSGLALRHGVTLLNRPGTIDADYRGEIQVLLVNLGQAPIRRAPRRPHRAARHRPGRARRPGARSTTLAHDATRAAGGFGHTGR